MDSKEPKVIDAVLVGKHLPDEVCDTTIAHVEARQPDFFIALVESGEWQASNPPTLAEKRDYIREYARQVREQVRESN